MSFNSYLVLLCGILQYPCHSYSGPNCTSYFPSFTDQRQLKFMVSDLMSTIFFNCVSGMELNFCRICLCVCLCVSVCGKNTLNLALTFESLVDGLKICGFEDLRRLSYLSVISRLESRR